MKGYAPLSIIFTLSLVLSAIAPISASHNESVNGNKKWTLMMYDDADGCYDIIDKFAREAYSNQNVYVIALDDSTYDTAKLWYIDSFHNKKLLDDWGEVNMGDSYTLKKFIEYCKENYPAERYILAIYNHGGAWQGACWDKTNNGWMTMENMKWALSQVGGVDIICFTAPCLMGSLEDVYELRDCVDVYLGSEPTSSYYIWESSNIMGKLCDLLKSHPDTSSIEIGKKIIEWMKNYPAKKDWFAMTACRTDKVNSLAEAIDKLSQDMLDNMFREYNSISMARDNAHEVDDVWTFLVDAESFFTSYESIATNETILQDIENAENALDAVIIDSYHASGREGCNGLSIHFPDNPSQYSSNRFYSSLDFARETHWKDLIHVFSCRLSKIKVVGSLNWQNVRPGKFLIGSFTVKNVGAPNTIMDWEISEKPEWGEWYFSMESGSVSAGNGQSVKVWITVPSESNSNFSGGIKIINKNNPGDYAILPVHITTNYGKNYGGNPDILNLIWHWLIKSLQFDSIIKSHVFPRNTTTNK